MLLLKAGVPHQFCRTQALGLMSSDYQLREAEEQADGLALLHGFLKHNRLRADIHSPTCPAMATPSGHVRGFSPWPPSR
ncbi:hypothetical protein EMIT0194MI4_50461 [Pseudomonas sp. IT-194MI4]